MFPFYQDVILKRIFLYGFFIELLLPSFSFFFQLIIQWSTWDLWITSWWLQPKKCISNFKMNVQRYPWTIYNSFFYLKDVAWWTCCERDDDDEWRKRQTTDISSMAIPRFFFFQARTACSTNFLAALGRSVVKETISIASWFEITSHIFYIQTKKVLFNITFYQSK